MSEIKFACPHCSQHIVCEDICCGESIDCPGCGKEMFVPRQAAFILLQAGKITVALPVASKERQYPRSAYYEAKAKNCPHCQKELPANNTADWCPFCGRDLFPDETQTMETPKANWLFFFAVLLAPAFLSMLGLATNLGGLVMLSTFIGSGVAGIICGGMLALRLADGMEANRLLVFIFSVVFAAVSFILCFAGCICAIPIAMQLKGH